MAAEQIQVNTHSSIRIGGSKVVYFDPFKIEEETHDADVICLTHAHFDHFDPDAMPILMSNPHTKLYLSHDCRKLIERLDMQRCKTEYMAPGESYTEGDFTLHFVSCDHGTLAPDAVGAIITVDGKNIFFAGDTCLRLD